MKEVCIIDRELRIRTRYQIMIRDRYGFSHVFPGKLFTLEQANEICRLNGFTVIATGDIWQCMA